MTQAFLYIHWLFAVLLMIALVISLLRFLVAKAGKRSFSKTDKRLSLITVTLAHLQFLAGLILYFTSSMGFQLFSREGADVMGNAALRLYAVEHPLINLIAVALLTIGRSRMKKKSTAAGKFNTLLIFFALGFLLLCSRMPWDRLFQLPG